MHNYHGRRKHFARVESYRPAEGKSTSQALREALAEYVVSHRTDRQHKNPLLALAGLGVSNGETNVSEREEEILTAEIDPIWGWSLRNDHDR